MFSLLQGYYAVSSVHIKTIWLRFIKASAEDCRLHQSIIWTKAFVSSQEFKIKPSDCTCALQIARSRGLCDAKVKRTGSSEE